MLCEYYSITQAHLITLSTWCSSQPTLTHRGLHKMRTSVIIVIQSANLKHPQPLKEREDQLELVEGSTECCCTYAVCVLLLCHGSSGLVVTHIQIFRRSWASWSQFFLSQHHLSQTKPTEVYIQFPCNLQVVTEWSRAGSPPRCPGE